MRSCGGQFGASQVGTRRVFEAGGNHLQRSKYQSRWIRVSHQRTISAQGRQPYLGPWLDLVWVLLQPGVSCGERRLTLLSSSVALCRSVDKWATQHALGRLSESLVRP